MSVEGLARFAASSSGRAYAASCERFGVDPVAALGDVDDVIAVSFRVALHHSLNTAAVEAQTEADADKPSDSQLLGTLADLERRMALDG